MRLQFQHDQNGAGTQASTSANNWASCSRIVSLRRDRVSFDSRRQPSPVRECELSRPELLRAGRLRFVLASRRTTASLYRRHPSGWPATALALSTRQPFESHNSFLDLGAFLAQFRKNLHKFHFLQG